MWNIALISHSKIHALQKKLFIEKKFFFSVDYVKIIELHVHTLNYMLYTHDFTCNLTWWNNEGNDIYKKDQ